jgi:hypothetical protein
VLPFCEKPLPEQRPELRVAQPDRGQVRGGTASSGGEFETDDSIFAAVSLRTFHAQFVQGFQIVLVDGRNDGTFFGSVEECSEGFELIHL